MIKKVFLSLFLFLGAGNVLAVDLTNVVPDIANPRAGNLGDAVGWVGNFYQFSLMAGVFLAVGVIVWAGLRYALAAGNASTQSDARDQILQALLGLVLLFGAYLILYTINPNLVVLKLETLTSVSAPAPVQNNNSAAQVSGTFQCEVSGVTTALFDTMAHCTSGCAPAGGTCSQVTK